MSDDYRVSNQRNRRPRGRGRTPGRSGESFRGSRQRPLLSTASHAAGFSFLALVLTSNTDPAYRAYILIAVMIFITSTLVSYVAQRIGNPWVEKLSDLFFVAGLATWVYVGALSAGLL